ncbi:hypothetical protein PRUPE_6G136000 [Prunus persica]|uniref:Uncharacterized protein n=1 Tax=Prunus persica TaxID=3760 RepID=A0A251NPY3_PRUPE|nr:hypothetical protein PRUPE_6G136000 [Prunus persica]
MLLSDKDFFSHSLQIKTISNCQKPSNYVECRGNACGFRHYEFRVIVRSPYSFLSRCVSWYQSQVLPDSRCLQWLVQRKKIGPMETGNQSLSMNLMLQLFHTSWGLTALKAFSNGLQM